MVAHSTDASDQVGVRELRQNLSRYLERVKAGETLTVTERGREVARLIPSQPGVDPGYVALARKYGATIPKNNLLAAIRSLPPLKHPGPQGATDAFLDESRHGEFGIR